MTSRQPIRIFRAIATTLILLLSVVGAGFGSPHSDTTAADTHMSIDSRFLQETREIWVHLPSSYEQSEKSYAVLYVLDAEWVFDFAVGSVGFLSGELAERMPEMIVVGIPNRDRARDFAVSFDTTATYINFMRFMEHELIPHIDGAHRTNPHRVIYGWSSGSNICLWMLFTRPHLFDGYIASGTGVSPRGYEFAVKQFGTHSYHGKGLFACAEGNAPPRREALNRFSTLLDASAPEGLRWKCTIMEEDDHTAVLAKGLMAGLEFLYAEWNETEKANETDR